MTRVSKTCPICKKNTVAEFAPFCSKRCIDVDLGHWLDERYKIPGQEVAPTGIEGEDD